MRFTRYFGVAMAGTLFMQNVWAQNSGGPSFERKFDITASQAGGFSISAVAVPKGNPQSTAMQPSSQGTKNGQGSQPGRGKNNMPGQNGQPQTAQGAGNQPGQGGNQQPQPGDTLAQLAQQLQQQQQQILQSMNLLNNQQAANNNAQAINNQAQATNNQTQAGNNQAQATNNQAQAIANLNNLQNAVNNAQMGFGNNPLGQQGFMNGLGLAQAVRDAQIAQYLNNVNQAMQNQGIAQNIAQGISSALQGALQAASNMRGQDQGQGGQGGDQSQPSSDSSSPSSGPNTQDLQSMFDNFQNKLEQELPQQAADKVLDAMKQSADSNQYGQDAAQQIASAPQTAGNSPLPPELTDYERLAQMADVIPLSKTQQKRTLLELSMDSASKAIKNQDLSDQDHQKAQDFMPKLATRFQKVKSVIAGKTPADTTLKSAIQKDIEKCLSSGN